MRPKGALSTPAQDQILWININQAVNEHECCMFISCWAGQTHSRMDANSTSHGVDIYHS